MYILLLVIIFTIMSTNMYGQPADTFPPIIEDTSCLISIPGKGEIRFLPAWLKKHPHHKIQWGKTNQWWPITLEIKSIKDFTDVGILRWISSNIEQPIYRLAWDVPKDGHQKITTYVCLQNSHSSHLYFTLGDSVSQDLSEFVPQNFAESNDEIILVLTSAQAFEAQKHLCFRWPYTVEESKIKAIHRRHIIWAEPKMFPENSLALQDFSAILVDDLGSEFPTWTSQQWRSLHDYVRGGGKLIICGGTNDSFLYVSGWEGLLPGKLQGVKKYHTASIHAGKNQYGQIATCSIRASQEKPLQVRQITPYENCSILANIEHDPWIVTKFYGLGAVLWIGSGFGDPYWDNLTPGDSVYSLVADRQILVEYILNFFPHKKKTMDISYSAQNLHSIWEKESGIFLPRFSYIIGFIVSYTMISLIVLWWGNRYAKYGVSWLIVIVWSGICSIICIMLIQKFLGQEIKAYLVSTQYGISGESYTRKDIIFSLLSPKTEKRKFSMSASYVVPSILAKQNIRLWDQSTSWLSTPNTLDILLYSRQNQIFWATSYTKANSWECILEKDSYSQIQATITNPTDINFAPSFILMDGKMYSLGELHKKTTSIHQAHGQKFQLDILAKNLEGLSSQIISQSFQHLIHVANQLQPTLVTFSQNATSLDLQGLAIHTVHSLNCLLISIPQFKITNTYLFYREMEPFSIVALPKKIWEITLPRIEDSLYNCYILNCGIDISIHFHTWDDKHTIRNIEIYNFPEKRWDMLPFTSGHPILLSSQNISLFGNKVWVRFLREKQSIEWEKLPAKVTIQATTTLSKDLIQEKDTSSH